MADVFGGVNAVILMSQLYYWNDKGHDPDGWVYKTAEELLHETGLTEKQQRLARNILKDLGVLAERPDRLHHRLYFRLNLDKIGDLWDSKANAELTKGNFAGAPK